MQRAQPLERRVMRSEMISQKSRSPAWFSIVTIGISIVGLDSDVGIDVLFRRRARVGYRALAGGSDSLRVAP